MAKQYIKIRGASEHNLKHVTLNIPRNELVVLTGLSGSGKSSLAFDTIYAEGQRRYMESLSSYARMFLGQMEKPDVESIEGLSPAISIDQKSTNRNPRSTAGAAIHASATSATAWLSGYIPPTSLWQPGNTISSACGPSIGSYPKKHRRSSRATACRA